MPALGWSTATLAVTIVYIRELGRATTGDNDFCGPMAKPHRMAVVTFAALLGAFWTTAPVLQLALCLVIARTAVTILRRSQRLINSLQQRQ